MSYNFILNSSNLVGVNNNQFKYDFINGSFTIPEDAEISISQITIPYSFYNISNALGNNTFSYSIPTGASNTTITVTLNDGFYGISDLNNALNKSLRENNFYFYNLSTVGFSNISSSDIIYPIQFSTNASNYTNTITFQYIPNGTAGVISQFGTNWVWANPSNFPTNASLPTITIPQQNSNNISKSTYGLGNIIGFTNATYPSTSALYYGLTPTFSTNIPSISNSIPLTINGNTLKTYNYNGSISSLTIQAANPAFSPLGTFVNGIIVRCNLVENNITMPSDILDSFAITSTFGSNINYLPSTNHTAKLKQGKVSSLIISLFDENLNPLIANDPNVLISLSINIPKK